MADSIGLTSFTFRYPGATHPALKDVSFAVRGGSCCAILGPTGSGKSTLLHAMAGVLGTHHPQAQAEGRITIGTDVYDPLPRSILFPRIGLVLQDPAVQVSGIRDTVEDEVRFALDNLGMGEEEALLRVNTFMAELGIGGLAKRSIRNLSGGELQRVALAGMLVTSPSVILLDEPLNSLDAPSQAQILRLLASFRGKRTVVVSDYGVDAALRLADTVVVLAEGKVVYGGTPSGLISRSEEFTDLLPAEALTRLSPLIGRTLGRPALRRFFSRIVEEE